jgi:lysozyme
MMTGWRPLVGLVACAIVGCSSGESAPPNECVQSGSEALRTCAGGTTLKGVDVSYYQGSITWASVKSAGNAFAFMRVSDGLSFPDSKFAANWAGAKAAGLIRGPYQFFRPGQDPTNQANAMLAQIDAAGGLAAGDLPPVLDLEVTDGQSASVVVSRALTWLSVVQKKIGVKPIVYTANFMSGTIGNSFGAYTLWVANYGASCPLMPSGWTSWQFWQNADNGNVGGIAGGVDTDLFNGSRAQLEALAVQGAKTKPPVVTGGGIPVGAKPDDPHPKDGSQGATIGDGSPGKSPDTTGAPFNPCAP